MNDLSFFEQEKRFSVNDFNLFIKEILNGIGEVAIEGEVSSLNISTRGGVNITLKDKKEEAVIQVSGYKPSIEGIDFIEPGMEVVAWGKPDLYPPYGKFSLSIYKVLPLGAGALAKAFELLKAKLDKEGLFDEERKRELPAYIQKIALITAKDSAAYSDFVKILKENEIGINIDFYPVAVQGKHAVQEICSTIENLNDSYDCVVLIRGGGSLEDLSAFNDEKVARIVFSSKSPILLAVGHERDESIAEFAADIRASTPSQAAYYLVSNHTNLINTLEVNLKYLEDVVNERLNFFYKNVTVSSPYSTILYKLQNFENNLLKLNLDVSSKLKNRIDYYKDIIDSVEHKSNLIEKEITYTKEQIINYFRFLESMNPKNVVNRGYAMIKDSKGNVLTSAKKVKIGDKINLELKDGKIITKINKIIKI